MRKQYEVIEYVGIAADESGRVRDRSYPLVEWGMTEADCLEYLKEKDFYNKLYDDFKRLGCWFCPKQNLKSLKIVHDKYPELWQQLLEWDKDSVQSFKADGKTVHDLDVRFKGEGK